VSPRITQNSLMGSPIVLKDAYLFVDRRIPG
jgi:hypothetical protein